MFRDMGLTDAALETVETVTRARLDEELASGTYVGWIAELDGQPVAGAGVMFHPYHPTVTNVRGRPTAYILNVYTEPAHRRRGLARLLIEEILAWCVAHDIPRASLHASDAGLTIYEQLGFVSTNELRLDLAKE